MSKQQTAVDWYIERLLDLDYQFSKQLISLDVYSTKKFYLQEQAKEMEKEQIKDAYWNGSDSIRTKTEILKEAEYFYNEIYGGNK